MKIFESKLARSEKFRLQIFRGSELVDDFEVALFVKEDLLGVEFAWVKLDKLPDFMLNR